MRGLQLLVVDDDESLRRWLRRVFADVTFVYLAADAGEARAALEEFAFDVVLCDHSMPGESGLAFLTHLAAVAPETRRVLFTADPPAAATSALEEGQLSAIVEKPARMGPLREVTLQPWLEREVEPASSAGP